MFFVDDLIMSPFKGFLFIAREVAKAVEQEAEQERTEVMSQLALLHSKVEKGEITDDEFDELETKLLDRLEQLGR